ncbi:MAG TPA: hypothetical protein VIC04_04675 [Terriglobia bacterium]
MGALVFELLEFLKRYRKPQNVQAPSVKDTAAGNDHIANLQHRAAAGRGYVLRALYHDDCCPPLALAPLGDSLHTEKANCGRLRAALADPQRGQTGERCFFVDQANVIRFNIGSPANASSTPVPPN